MISAQWLVASVRMHNRAWLNWLGIQFDQVVFGFMLAAVTLVFTLPQAILLWTEPDMEED